MNPIIGKTYKTVPTSHITERFRIAEMYRDKEFIVTNVDDTHAFVTFTDSGDERTINLDRWEYQVMEIYQSKWDGSAIKFHFLA